jgi:FtsP/CotA-like multicopper oxidase with cupredoxin domain
VQAAGMGIVVEYANRNGKPVWQQPEKLQWNYAQFADTAASPTPAMAAIEFPMVFESKFAGHGAPDHWSINGKSWPNVESPLLQTGQRYRLIFKNPSSDDHPVHLHRHSFELRNLPGNPDLHGILKDVLLVESKTEVHVEFTANHPGPTLFHCHQQNHMDEGFMLLFHYA